MLTRKKKTYHAGLSGGAWLLSSFAGNNYPTITSLKDGLWKQAFQDSLLDPAYLFAAPAYLAVTNDIEAKEAAGYVQFGVFVSFPRLQFDLRAMSWERRLLFTSSRYPQSAS